MKKLFASFTITALISALSLSYCYAGTYNSKGFRNHSLKSRLTAEECTETTTSYNSAFEINEGTSENISEAATDTFFEEGPFENDTEAIIFEEITENTSEKEAYTECLEEISAEDTTTEENIYTEKEEETSEETTSEAISEETSEETTSEITSEEISSETSSDEIISEESSEEIDYNEGGDIVDNSINVENSGHIENLEINQHNTTVIDKSHTTHNHNTYNIIEVNPEPAAPTVNINSETYIDNSNTFNISAANLSLTIGDSNIIVDGENISTDTTPYIQETTNSTMVPLRVLSEQGLGAQVSWEPQSKTAVVSMGDKTLYFKANTDYYLNNGVIPNENGAVSEIKEGRLYLPLRTAGQALGYQVEWNPITKTVTLINQ